MPKVGFYEYKPAGVKLPINFTARTGLFSCQYAGTQYEAKELAPLQDMLLAAVKASYDLEWIAVIEVTLRWEKGRYAGISFILDRERYYVAHHTDLGYRQCHWSADVDQRLANSQIIRWNGEFLLPTRKKFGDQMFLYFPYSEESWAALEETHNSLQLGIQTLCRLLTGTDAIRSLQQASQRLFDLWSARDDQKAHGAEQSTNEEEE